MLSFAWKHPKTAKVHCRGLIDYPGYYKDKTNDQKLIKDLWQLFDTHDILIGHNIARFDVRKANSRFIYWGLKPPSPCRLVDTLREIRKVAYQDSNKLGSVSQFMGFGDKLPTQGWDTWRGAIDGHRPSWTILKKYNRHDVVITEKVWERLAPWMRNHPPMHPYGCPVCGDNMHRRGRVRQSNKFQFNCPSCGHWRVAKPP